MHMSKRTIAYVEGNSCRDVESIHCTLWKGICTCLFVVLICYWCLFWLKLCIYVGHLESCWECTVVAFVTEATMFGFGKNRLWYLLQKWHVNMSTPKKWRSQHPPPFFQMRISTLAVPRCSGSPRRWQWGIQWAWEGHGMENPRRKWRF